MANNKLSDEQERLLDGTEDTLRKASSEQSKVALATLRQLRARCRELEEENHRHIEMALCDIPEEELQCVRCGLTDATVLEIDTGSACHPELKDCISALRSQLATVTAERDEIVKQVNYWSYCIWEGMNRLAHDQKDKLRDFFCELKIHPYYLEASDDE